MELRPFLWIRAIKISNNRAIRKLLEVTGVDRYLLSNGS
jgi:hypothetical protein